MKFGTLIFRSGFMNIPYRNQQNELINIIKLDENIIDDVFFSFNTFFITAKGDPDSMILMIHPINPIIDL